MFSGTSLCLELQVKAPGIENHNFKIKISVENTDQELLGFLHVDNKPNHKHFRFEFTLIILYKEHEFLQRSCS